MSTSSMGCTNVSQREYNGAWDSDYTSNSGYAGFTVNSNGTKNRRVMIIKFTTPAFKGVSVAVHVTHSAKENYANGDVTLRWALCTSDSNKSKYVGTGSAVTDSNQIASGKKTYGGGTSSYMDWSLSIGSGTLKPSTTYYVFLWAYDISDGYSYLMQLNSASKHNITLAYYSGVVHLYNGSAWKTAVVWVYDGDEWKRAIPWVYDGEEWKNTC